MYHIGYKGTTHDLRLFGTFLCTWVEWSLPRYCSWPLASMEQNKIWWLLPGWIRKYVRRLLYEWSVFSFQRHWSKTKVQPVDALTKPSSNFFSSLQLWTREADVILVFWILSAVVIIRVSIAVLSILVFVSFGDRGGWQIIVTIAIFVLSKLSTSLSWDSLSSEGLGIERRMSSSLLLTANMAHWWGSEKVGGWKGVEKTESKREKLKQ